MRINNKKYLRNWKFCILLIGILLVLTGGVFAFVGLNDSFSGFDLVGISDIYSKISAGKINPEDLFFLDESGNEIKVKSITKENYLGKIYDVDVENDIVLVRRKGDLEIWSGNSDSNQTCGVEFDYIVDPTITIGEVDVATDSLLVNVTAEGNFTHLTVSDSAPYDNLVGYWNFDGDAENTKLATHYDWSGAGNDGTGVGDAVVNSSGGFMGDGLVLDGAGDYVNVGDDVSLNITDEITISSWVKAPVYSVTAPSIIGPDSSGNGYNSLYALYLRTQVDNQIAWNFNNGTHNKYIRMGNMPTDTWIHIATTRNSSDMYIYLNGVPYTEGISTSAPIARNFVELNIGFADSLSNFNGSIDEVMIFNTSLTQEQITEIYNNQSARFKSEGTQKVRAVNVTNTGTWENGGDNQVNLSVGLEREMSSNLSARIGQMNLSVDPEGLVLYMPFEWGRGVDISGEGNDGSLEGDVTFNSSGGLNETGGFEFDGDGDYVDTTFNGTEYNELTFTFWAKSIETSPTRHILDNSPDSSGYIIRQGSSIITFFVYLTSVGLKSDTVNIPDTGWHFYSVRVNDTYLGISIDGVAVASPTTFASSTIVASNDLMTVGSDISGSNSWNGTIDEVLIFNRSLSATEIANLYNNQSAKFNVPYYTDYQNLTGSEENTTFTISKEADFIFPDFKFSAGNSTNPFYSPILFGDIILDTYTTAVGDTEYPTFSNYWDDNGTLLDSGTGKFNVTVASTNGTVILHINGNDITATNLTSNVYNASYTFSSSGTYTYNWTAYGNGTSHNLNTSINRYYTVNETVDTEYPTFSNFLFGIANNTQYVENTDHQFNTTITSTNATAGIEFDGTNYSLSNISSSFYKTFSGLSAGSYSYYWWAFGNGTSHLFNNSINYGYTIAQNSSLTLGLTATTPITYPAVTDFTGSNCPSQLSCSLNISNQVYGAGTISANYSTAGNTNYTATSTVYTVTINQNSTYNFSITGTTPIIYPAQADISNSTCPSQINCVLNRNDTGVITSPDNSVLSAGFYNYTFNTTGNANYTANSTSFILEVQKNTTSCNILFNTTTPQTYPNKFRVYSNCSSDSYITRNGTIIANNSEQDLSAGFYNFTVYRNDTTNYTNIMDTSDFQITQATPVITKLLNGGATNLTITYPQESNATGSTTGGTIFIYRDNTNVTIENGLNTSLSVGTYTYKFNVTGNTNYSSLTGEYMNLTIYKGAPEGNLTNTTSWTLTYPTEVTIGLSESQTGDNDLTYIVYRDGVAKGTGETITLGVGTYDYVLNATGGTNWTANASMDTETLTINQNTSAVIYTYLNHTRSNITIYNNTAIWLNSTLQTGDPGATLNLYNNEVLINSGTTALSNLTDFNGTGIYNITTIYVSSQNYTVSSETWFVNVTTAPDTTKPIMVITYPTNTTYTINVSAINYTYTEENSGHCWYSKNSGATNSSAVSMGTNFTNVISSEGSNTWIVYCNDSSNNENSTSITFFKDTIAPIINIIFPTNTTYTTNVSALNYTSDGVNCWYSLDLGVTNSSPENCGTNWTGLSSSEGSNTWIVYSNDSANNLNSSSLTFFKDTIYPLIDYGTGTLDDDSRIWNTNVYVNVSVTETNFKNISFNLYYSNDTLINSTDYVSEVWTINWTGLSGEDYKYNVSVYDGVGNLNSTATRDITLIGSQSNISLNTGWNLVSLGFDNTDNGTDRNISVVAGWNLIGYSSNVSLNLEDVKFHNGSNEYSWANAISNNKVQAYLSYYDSSSATASLRKYKYTATSDFGMDDSALREGKGYWVYMNESGNLTLPSVGGSLADETYDWDKLRFWNGTSELNVTDAGDEGWVTTTLQYWDTDNNGFRYVCAGTGFPYPSKCLSTSLGSYNGYFIWSNKNNITLIRQN